jgi:histidinol-phosphate aminotransferase
MKTTDMGSGVQLAGRNHDGTLVQEAASYEEFSFSLAQSRCPALPIINLASNENPFGAPPGVVEFWPKILANCHKYPTESYQALREVIVERLGSGIGTDNVIITNGSTELLQLIVRAHAKADDEIIVQDPTWPPYALFAKQQGASVVKVPNSQYVCDLDGMLQRITERTRAIIICNPSNPVGTIVEAERLEKWVADVPEGVLIVFDEAYFEFVCNGLSPRMVDSCKNRPLIVVRTFSKAYGLAGLRIGYGISSGQIIDKLMRLRLPYSNNTAGLMAARMALLETEFIQKTKKFVEKERVRVSDKLRSLGYFVPESQANFVFAVTRYDAQHLANQLLSRGIWVRSFGPSAIRVGIGTEEQNQRLLQSLAEIA